MTWGATPLVARRSVQQPGGAADARRVLPPPVRSRRVPRVGEQADFREGLHPGVSSDPAALAECGTAPRILQIRCRNERAEQAPVPALSSLLPGRRAAGVSGRARAASPSPREERSATHLLRFWGDPAARASRRSLLQSRSGRHVRGRPGALVDCCSEAVVDRSGSGGLVTA
jgi:hypothetical protein